MSGRRYNESSEDYAKRLEEELYFARLTLLEVLPEQFRECLDSFREISTRRGFLAWESQVIEKVIERTPGGPENDFVPRRAACPLCKDEGSDPYTTGFKLDEGLRRHLSGWGSTRQCPVIREAFAFAYYCLRDEIAQGERDEAEARELAAAERRRTERLFVVDPSEPPKLLNESSSGYFRDPKDCRGANELVFAEQRLREIGFEIQTTDRVTTYRFTSGECNVLADPREKGRITFLVYMQNPKRKKTAYLTRSFHLPDSWKKELSRKFADRLEEAKDALVKGR